MSTELDPRRSWGTFEVVPSNTGPAARPLQLRRSAAALAREDGRLGWMPIVAALAIDLADFATAGPIGLVAGLVVGGVLTTIVALASGSRPGRALLLGLVGGIYCALPMTEAIPLATMLTLVHGFLLRTRAQPGAQRPTDSAA